MSRNTDHEARERGRYLARTTTLTEREARAIAYSELGYSDSGIAKRIECEGATVKRYRERAAARYGHRAIEPKPSQERGHTDLATVTKDEITAYPPGTREWWVEAARGHPDMAPEWADQLDEGGKA